MTIRDGLEVNISPLLHPPGALHGSVAAPLEKQVILQKDYLRHKVQSVWDCFSSSANPSLNWKSSVALKGIAQNSF